MAKKKPPTKAESEHMAKVASLGCYVWNNFPDRRKECGNGIEVHHKTGCGMAKRASHYETMPLCFNHHSAQTPLKFGKAVHKGTKSFEERYGTQDQMIEWTLKKIEELEYV